MYSADAYAAYYQQGGIQYAPVSLERKESSVLVFGFFGGEGTEGEGERETIVRVEIACREGVILW